ncbi:hypothetical protein PUN28_008560 [Cardiocondyla obscurior]|uniref:Uncharacterized protein n=1 Tax=Cardiocondyla obscurior TaxID=286306 RepID=A0AAW2G4G3_9HYME
MIDGQLFLSAYNFIDYSARSPASATRSTITSRNFNGAGAITLGHTCPSCNLIRDRNVDRKLSETMGPSHVDGYVSSRIRLVSIHRVAAVENMKAERNGRSQAARGNRSGHVPRIGLRQLVARIELFPRDEEIVFGASRRCGRRSAGSGPAPSQRVLTIAWTRIFLSN